MKILLDECLPVKLKNEFSEFSCFTVKDNEWTGIKNGELLRRADKENFDVFITIDKKIIFQINKENLNIALVIIESDKNDLKTLKDFSKNIKGALEKIKRKQIIRISKSGTVE